MAENSGIQWTTHTFNPWMGCARVSPACEHCYAETLVTGRMKLPVWGPASTTARKRTAASTWALPSRWNRAAAVAGRRDRVFCASLADVFEEHPMLSPWRAELWSLIEQTPHLDWLLLTKRPQNIAKMLPAAWLSQPRANVWLGTTVEDQRRAEERIPHLLSVPATVHFLSCEPLLGPLDLGPFLYVPTSCNACGSAKGAWYDTNPDKLPVMGKCSMGVPMTGEPGASRCMACNSRDVRELPPISWVIAGGESGAGARFYDLAWARSLRDQCAEAGVPFFHKQLGARPILSPGPLTWPTTSSHGGEFEEFPEDLRVREMPEAARG